MHPLTRANYLASPPLCVAFAIAGKRTTAVCFHVHADAANLEHSHVTAAHCERMTLCRPRRY